jgi:hypothetical protein
MRFQRTNERRGVILMVVLALLTLFAIVGVAFVLYAQAEATSARVAREAETAQLADVPPEELLAVFLGQLLYDVHDAAGYNSAVRGHSLGRDMYGYNNGAANIIPFNGVGRLHTNGTTWPYQNPYNIDDQLLVNYTWFPTDGFARDPEWYAAAPQTSPTAAKAGGTGAYVGGNSPYTYPDLNHLFLAAVKADGTVLSPSFYRSYTGFGTLDPSNPNWYDATKPFLKYMVMRPRPAEHPNFPPPEDAGGDVRNLPWSKGGIDPITKKPFQNDSIWMDFGFPVMTAPDGTKYKPLVAPLIMDLDNRINIAAAGNLRGITASRSNQGWFPSEMNLAYVLASTTSPTEWQHLFTGNGSYNGKYGTNKIPDSPLFPTGSAAHVYAPADLDGSNEGAGYAATGAITLPTAPGPTNPNPCFPTFPQGYGSGSALERANHPAGYAVYKSPLLTNNLLTITPNDDLVFRPSDMEALLRPSSLTSTDTGSSALISTLSRLCPQNLLLSNSALQRRNSITTVSNDLAKPGLSPWLLNPTLSPYAINPLKPSLPPLGVASPFPAFISRSQPLPQGTDFTVNWRALAAALGRIDLNRPLPPFPHMTSGSTKAIVAPNQRFDTNPQALVANTTAMQARQAFANDIYRALLVLTGADAPMNNKGNPLAGNPQDLLNLAARRSLAQLAVNIVDYIDADEISTPFNFYSAIDGAANIYQLVPTNSTIPAFPNGNPDVPAYWVYGTELPRLVINEVLGQYTLPTTNGATLANTFAKTGPFNVNVWVELFNPMPAAANPTVAANPTATYQPIDSLPVPLYHAANGMNPAYNPYEIIIANNNTVANAHGLWYNAAALNSNVLGTPQQQRYVNPAAKNPVPAGCYFNSGAGSAWTVLAPPPAKPSYPITQPNGLPAQTYMIVGPPGNDVHNDILAANITAAGGNPATTPWLQSPNMQYGVTNYHANLEQWHINGVQVLDNLSGVSVLLRRLANPHLPPNPYLATGGVQNPALPPNPYITVDYMHGVPLNGYGLVNNAHVPISSINNPLTATVNPGKPAPPNNSPLPPASYGKLQPYAANFTQVAAQTTPMPPVVGKTTPQPRTRQSLGLQNTPIANPFTWLVHLDRKLISPMELLHVSAFPSHDLTQRFIMVPNASNPIIPQPYQYTPVGGVANSAYFQHYAPWFDQRRRLYRLFELLEAHDAASGVSPVNGRVPGKININTLWDLPTTDPQMYLAIADPSPTPDNTNFNVLNTTSAFQKLLALRTPNLATTGLSAADRPFLGMGASFIAPGDAQYPSGSGINHTLLTSGVIGTPPTTVGTGAALQLPVTNAAAPQIGGAHPYLQNQLLTKVYNNLTTRSNVFAVFLTVGFFEVTGVVPGSTIPQLGAEIGRSEGRQVRHRMFAIVDRTNMSVFTTRSNTPVTAPTSPSSPTTATVQVPALSGPNPNTGAAWSIAAGTLLVIEPGTVNEETVIVSSVTPANPVTGTQASFTANFLRAHPNPAVTGNPSSTYAITQRGNPGPWKRYSPRNDPGVVLYYNIID